MKLSEQDLIKVLEAIQNPPPPADALIRAFEKYKKLVKKEPRKL